MDIKLEIFAEAVNDAIRQAIEYIHITTDNVRCVAMVVLGEIRGIIQDETIEDDFYVVEEIVKVFEKYHIDAGGRHDFG